MRIILVQAEIEQAIQEYVGRQISVREGQDVNVDFKNTRGDDGATAEINIKNRPGSATKVDDDKPPFEPDAQPNEPANSSSNSGSNGKSKAKKKTEPEQEPEYQTSDTGAKEAARDASSEDQTTKGSPEKEPEPQSDTSSESEPSQEQAQEQDNAPVTKPSAPATGKSLFGNLKKPVNNASAA